MACLVVFLIVAAAYSYLNRDPYVRDHNVESRLALVRAMVDEHRFEIDSYHNTLFATGDKAFYRGHYYSDKAVGSSMLGAIVYKGVLWSAAKAGWVIRFKYFRDVMTILTIGIPSALIAPFLYLIAQHISSSPGKALFVAFGISFGTPFFKYSTLFYGHTLAGVFLLLSFYLWFQYRQLNIITWPRALLSGFLAGWMVITEYPTVILAAGLGVYALYTLWEKGRLLDWELYLPLGFGALIPVSVLLFYNYASFGGPFVFGYTHEAREIFRSAHATGFFGVGWPDPATIYAMTFHPTMGIFWQSPVLLFALPGWYLMLKTQTHRAEAWFTLLSVVIYTAFFSGYYMWWGGSSFTPRHLIPVLPLFALPLVFLPRKLFPFAVAAGVISIMQNLIVSVGSSEGLGEFISRRSPEGLFLPSGGSTIYDIFLPNLMGGKMVQTLGGSLFGLNGFQSLIPLLILEIILVAALIIIIGGRQRPESGSATSQDLSNHGPELSAQRPV